MIPNLQKYLILGFRSAFLKKILDSPFEIWFWYWLRYRPKVSTNLDFGSGIGPKTKIVVSVVH